MVSTSATPTIANYLSTEAENTFAIVFSTAMYFLKYSSKAV